MRVPAWLESPFITLCVPPALAILQFLAFVKLLSMGFPTVPKAHFVEEAWLIVALFGLCAPALAAAGWGIRQAALGSNKLGPALGVAFNLSYFFGFVIFYMLVFVTHASS